MNAYDDDKGSILSREGGAVPPDVESQMKSGNVGKKAIFVLAAAVFIFSIANIAVAEEILWSLDSDVDFSSASSGEKDCDFFSCPFGCCDAQGNCHTEWSAEFCGYYGEDCETCAVPTPYCFFEVFYAQCTECNFLTCPGGCCGEDGLCHEEADAEYCGLAGSDCETCSSPEPNCWAGLCVGCDAFTCPTGCCDEDEVCHTENTPDHCGITGVECFTCSGDTPNCYNGYCVGCSDMFPCPDGCCDLRTSLCHAGDDNEMCGTVGGNCDNCEIEDLFCQEGQCVECNASTCPTGCCDSNGACRSGTEDNFCGTGAIDCVNCISLGDICVDYLCVPPADDDTVIDDTVDDDDDTGFLPCGPDNCQNGCCQDGQCWPGTADDKCGDGAAACVNCQESDLVCEGSQCTTPPDDDTVADDATDDADDVGDDTTGIPSSGAGDDDDSGGGCGC